MPTKQFLALSILFAISGCASAPQKLDAMTVCTPVTIADATGQPVNLGAQCVTEGKAEGFFVPWNKLGDSVLMPREDFKAFVAFCRIQRKGE